MFHPAKSKPSRVKVLIVRAVLDDAAWPDIVPEPPFALKVTLYAVGLALELALALGLALALELGLASELGCSPDIE